MTSGPPHHASISDPVADDYWSFEDDHGHQHVSRVTLGRPAPIPKDANGDWYCPVVIGHAVPITVSMVGVGPVDALLNAARFVREHLHELRKVSPRATPPGSTDSK
ncbi:hypothetical protein [Corallococcus exiguus]|uniref:hypothetical protein n=1 Tax=Corallococcus exiguus TaxID=83462 RepID=UPI003DA27AA9